MADTPKDNSTEPPAPEVLKPKADDGTEPAETGATAGAANAPKPPKRLRRGSYRPSHKATFIGLIVVVAILAVNAGVIAFVLKGQSKDKSSTAQGQVTVSQATLDKLGVNRSPVGDAGIVLTINPNAKFGGNVQIGGDTSIGGQLTLNSTFNTSSAKIGKLQAGDTSLSQLNVNGDGTVSNLNLRKDLVVAGTARLQGVVTLSQLLTVNNNVNISGNLSVGGFLAASAFQISNLTLTGHVITAGSAPAVSRGSALGSNGTASISGNDAAGTVAANTGVGASSGQVACVTFRTAYATIPHVVVSASGPLDVYVSRSSTGFCIYAGNSLSVGVGYAFDYIVEQ